MGSKRHHAYVGYAVFALVAMLAPMARAQVGPEPVVRVRTAWSQPQAHAGDRLVLAVVLDVRAGYHINPSRDLLDDDSLIPTELQVTAITDGLATSPVRYPRPVAVMVGPPDELREVDAYEERVVLYLPVDVADTARPAPKRLDLTLVFQPCDQTVCLPPESIAVTATLHVLDASVPIDMSIDAASDAGLFDGYELGTDGDVSGTPIRFDVFGWAFSLDQSTLLGFGLLLAVAGVGGLLLNFTPCVLPVIPIKMMGLSHSAGSRSRCLALGLAMSLGVVAFWLAMGGAIASVSGFTATNQLFQYPAFTVGVGVVIAVMAVGMFGVFTVRLPRFIYAIDPRRDSLPGSFTLGVMAAVLSTPCTAPFMGAAAAWAAGQPPTTTLATFAAIGGGMALPYLILSAYPGLVRWMPRSGPASELIKQLMGLGLLAVAAYFVGVGLTGWLITPPDPPSLVYWWPVMVFIGAAGGWLAYRALRITVSPAGRAVAVCTGLLMLAGSVYGGVWLTSTGSIDWVYYTPQRLAQAQRERKTVVMDFTAEWCLNCKWLERQVLTQPDVVEALSGDNVVPMKVDLTGSNPDGRRKLQDTSRVAIPLLVIYDPAGREVFKSDFYTARQLLDAVTQATDQGAN